MNRVILACLDGTNNAARIVTEKADVPCRRIILPDDRERAVNALFSEMERCETTVVVLLEQKSRIKDKIYIESTAVCGDVILRTSMDVRTSARIIKSSGYNVKISEKSCGGSLCSHIYCECLKRAVCCVLLHIPTLCNISDLCAVTKAVEYYINGIPGIPCALSYAM